MSFFVVSLQTQPNKRYPQKAHAHIEYLFSEGPGRGRPWGIPRELRCHGLGPFEKSPAVFPMLPPEARARFRPLRLSQTVFIDVGAECGGCPLGSPSDRKRSATPSFWAMTNHLRVESLGINQLVSFQPSSLDGILRSSGRCLCCFCALVKKKRLKGIPVGVFMVGGVGCFSVRSPPKRWTSISFTRLRHK